MWEDIKLQVEKGNMLRHSFKERTSLRRKLIAKFSLRTGKTTDLILYQRFIIIKDDNVTRVLHDGNTIRTLRRSFSQFHWATPRANS